MVWFSTTFAWASTRRDDTASKLHTSATKKNLDFIRQPSESLRLGELSFEKISHYFSYSQQHLLFPGMRKYRYHPATVRSLADHQWSGHRCQTDLLLFANPRRGRRSSALLLLSGTNLLCHLQSKWSIASRSKKSRSLL